MVEFSNLSWMVLQTLKYTVGRVLLYLSAKPFSHSSLLWFYYNCQNKDYGFITKYMQIKHILRGFDKFHVSQENKKKSFPTQTFFNICLLFWDSACFQGDQSGMEPAFVGGDATGESLVRILCLPALTHKYLAQSWMCRFFWWGNILKIRQDVSEVEDKHPRK